MELAKLGLEDPEQKLTLRDRIAMSVAAPILSGEGCCESAFEDAAILCYKFADAMLAAREGGR